MLGRTLSGPRGLYGCEKVLHVHREIFNAIIVCDCSNGAEVDAFLVGVSCDMRPDLLEKIEDVSATQISRCCPLFPPGAPQEEAGQEVKVDTISAETETRLRLRVLYGQIDVPAGLPQF